VRVGARRLACALAALVPGARLVAQQPADTVIDTVIVVSHNVFEPPDGTPRVVARLGNALHITTRPGVIRRLMLMGPGTPVDSARLIETERYLRELGVFRFVLLDTVRVDDRLALRVETGDGWSTSPQLNFASAAGSITWSAAMVERNFLGAATFVSLAYGHNPDRHSVDVQFASPGLVLHHAPLLAAYSSLSDGRLGAWRYGRPFYRSDARWSLVTEGEAASHRVLEFRHDTLTQALLDSAQERRALSFTLTGGVAVRATERSYVRVWGSAGWRREDFAPESSTTFAYSGFGTLGVGVDAGRVRYAVIEHLNGFGRREDVDLSSTLRLGLWAAPREWGYPAGRAGVGPEVQWQVGARWRRGLALLRGELHGVVGTAGLDSGLARGTLDVASLALPGHAVLLHLEGGALRRPKFGEVFDPWSTQNGPRGFGAHAFTGTRLVYAMLEDRVVVADELWGLVGLGVAPYVEYGGAWYAEREAARLGGDAGLALRLGSPRSSRGDVAELDVSWRWGEGFTGSPWALTFRKSFTLK
jgi:hypothetical protein